MSALLVKDAEIEAVHEKLLACEIRLLGMTGIADCAAGDLQQLRLACEIRRELLTRELAMKDAEIDRLRKLLGVAKALDREDYT